MTTGQGVVDYVVLAATPRREPGLSNACSQTDALFDCLESRRTTNDGSWSHHQGRCDTARNMKTLTPDEPLVGSHKAICNAEQLVRGRPLAQRRSLCPLIHAFAVRHSSACPGRRFAAAVRAVQSPDGAAEKLASHTRVRGLEEGLYVVARLHLWPFTPGVVTRLPPTAPGHALFGVLVVRSWRLSAIRRQTVQAPIPMTPVMQCLRFNWIGTPGRNRTCAHGLGNHCSIP